MSDEPEAMVGRAFMEAADHTIVVADHTKIGNTTFARLCPLADLDLLITDNGMTPHQLAKLEAAKLQVQVADHYS